MSLVSLLILILLSNGDDVALAEQLAAELRQQAGARAVEIVVGKPAVTQLEEMGISSADLLASPRLGSQLTKHQDDLVVIHLQTRLIRGDRDLDVHLWMDGRLERVGGIAGEGGEVWPFLRRGVGSLLAERLGGTREGVGEQGEQSLTRLVENEAWPEALALLAGQTELSAKEHYYKVLAYSRLQQRQSALEAFNEMRQAHGRHWLVAAATELITPERQAVDPVDDGRGSVLRDTGGAAEEPAAAARAPTPPSTTLEKTVAQMRDEAPAPATELDTAREDVENTDTTNKVLRDLRDDE